MGGVGVLAWRAGVIPDPEAMEAVLKLGPALDRLAAGDAPCACCAATGRVVGSVGDVATVEHPCGRCGGDGWVARAARER